MPRTRRAGLLSAVLTAIAFSTAPAPATTLSLTFDPDPAWRSAATPDDLATVFETWLDEHSDLPRRADPPVIRIIGSAEAARLSGTSARMGQRTRGLYDPETATIYLIEPWRASRALDASVLLHELVHHRQQTARHWYCPGAQEPQAYALQEAWLAERGLTAEVNHIAVVLEAGCTPRDIHPD